MRQLRPVLLLLLLAGCTETVEVTVQGGSWDSSEKRFVAYEVETLRVTCRPSRNITYAELLIDSAVVDVDTFPGPESNLFGWDVRQLPEGSVHTLQGRAISGSREYLSPEVSITVGYRSRLLVEGKEDTLLVYRPDGMLDYAFKPLDNSDPDYPRFRPGCHSCVFIGDHVLYEATVPYGQARWFAAVGNGIYSCDASPVSDLVAFEAYPAGTAHLFTQDTFGNRVQLTHDSDFVLIDSSRFTCIANSSPVFSPDGTRLAYCRKSKCLVPDDPHEGETREDAFVMNRDGSNPVNLTSTVDDGYFSGFTWTFDGKWLLFRKGTGWTPDGVFAANVNGRAIVGLAVVPVAMACSPDDSTLVFIGTDQGHPLYSARLGWTDDTLYVEPGILFNGETFALRVYIDWVRYSKQ